MAAAFRRLQPEHLVLEPPVRVLVVSHPTLTAELGAAQLALSLATALRDRGHDAVAWSPEPLPAGTAWWNLWLRQRRAIEDFAAAHGPFDAIDLPAISASRRLARMGPLVARSVQPELLYMRFEALDDLRRAGLRAPAHVAHKLPRAAAVAGGWRRARRIVCLGSHELAWMRRRFPFWRPRLRRYLASPSTEDQAALAILRQRRAPWRGGQEIRFLWLGRWTAHKGTVRLLRFLSRRLPAAPGETFTLAGCGAAAAAEIPRDWIRSGRVRLIPAYSRSELPSLLADHDAGIFTSEAEGWGLSLSEMLESGLPVFATEAGAVPDLQPFFPGFLLPFPPPPRPVLPAAPPDLQANGYYREMSWPVIAQRYEAEVLADLCVS